MREVEKMFAFRFNINSSKYYCVRTRPDTKSSDIGLAKKGCTMKCLLKKKLSCALSVIKEYSLIPFLGEHMNTYVSNLFA